MEPFSQHKIESESLKQRAHEEGFELVGLTSANSTVHHAAYENWIAKGFHAEMDYLSEHSAIKRSAQNLLPGAQSILMVGLNYYQPMRPGPKIARYAIGRDYHKVIRKKLARVAKWAQELDPSLKFRICVDSAPLLEREHAHLAGLGWFGKNTMLINSQRGSWFLLGALLLNLKLDPDAPALGGCGTCTKCVEQCPTGAIVLENERWQVNSSRCISYQTIELPVINRKKGRAHEPEETHGWAFGCDICQEVCPFNEIRESQPLRSAETQEQDFRSHRIWPGTLPSKTVWEALTEGTPIRRAGYEGFSANAQSDADKLLGTGE